MTKPKPKPMPQRRNKHTFKPGNRFAFRPRDADTDNAAPEVVALRDDTGQFTAAALARVERLASLDRSPATIANSIGMTVKEFGAALKTNAALANALEVGTGRARDFYVDRLRALGKKNFVPHIYLGKALHGMSDAAEQSDDNRVTVQIVSLPGALPPSAFPGGRIIEGTRLLELPDDDNPNVVRPSLPRTETEPGDAAPMPEAGEHQPRREQTPQERAGVRDYEHKIGINSYDPGPNDFPSEAAWHRWNKQR